MAGFEPRSFRFVSLPDSNPGHIGSLGLGSDHDGRGGIRTEARRSLTSFALRLAGFKNPARSVIGFAVAQPDNGRGGIRTHDQKVRNLLPSPLGHTPPRKQLVRFGLGFGFGIGLDRVFLGDWLRVDELVVLTFLEVGFAHFF